MKQKLMAWLEITGTAVLAVSLLAGVGLASYLVVRIVYAGVMLTSMTFK